MKSKLVALTLLLPVSAALASAADTPPANPPGSEQTDAPTPASILAAQVKEIASSTTPSHKSQVKLIATAVRLAITTAIAGTQDPEARLKIALDLATTAAKAAPNFAATITSAVSGLPALSGIAGATDRIQAAVRAGVETADEPGVASPAPGTARPPANPEFSGPNQSETVVSPSH